MLKNIILFVTFFFQFVKKIEQSLQTKNDSSHSSSANVLAGAVRHNNSV